MSVTAVHCCKLVREKIICMCAPQLLLILSQSGRGHSQEMNLQKYKRPFYPLSLPFHMLHI